MNAAVATDPAYYVHHAGSTFGPFHRSTIVSMLHTHQLDLDDLIAEAGADWERVRDVVDPALHFPPQPVPLRLGPSQAVPKPPPATFLAGPGATLLKLAALTAIIFGLVWLAQPSATPGRSAPQPRTTVAVDRLRLSVANLDHTDWPDLTLHVNGVVGGYRYTHGRSIPAGTTLEIPLTELHTRGGDRFDPLRKKVTEVIVRVPNHDCPVFRFR